MTIGNRKTNSQLAQFFHQIADLLEIKGEIIYKILAYRKAADTFSELDRQVFDIWQEGKLLDIPGVGKAISEKVDELLATGTLAFYEKLTREVPTSLIELLRVPDVGPKKVALFWKQLGITTLAELSEAAQAGRLRELPGMGEKSESKILAGLEYLSRQAGRIPLGKAWLAYQDLANYLSAVPGVQRVDAAGSLRRRRVTIGDLDILVASIDSGLVMTSFVEHPDVIRVIGQGETKSSVEFSNGLRAQLWVHPLERFGTALQYATGSKEHNVRLRELALKRGLSLSEHALSQENGQEILCAEEEKVYQLLGLHWIPPELREDRGEVQASLAGELPRLVELDDMLAELHTHSQWSDGTRTIRQMADEARVRGKRILAITDHSVGLGVAGGLTVEDLSHQRQEINEIQADIGNSILILQGCEVEIRADGTLDYPDEVLAGLDFVIASLHASLRQPREKITQRLVNAIHNPHVDLIGHPTGRLIPDREGADLDMEIVLQAALERGVALEINAHPSRLDLDDIYTRRAVTMGIPLSINTDAHSPNDLDLLHFGVSIARRGWAEADDIINTWPEPKLLAWLHGR